MTHDPLCLCEQCIAHDPLCPTWADRDNDCPSCDLIAKVRADERSKAEHDGYVRGYAHGSGRSVIDVMAVTREAALRDAVEAVKGLPRFDEYGYGLVVHPDGDFWDRKEVVAAIEALGGESRE